MKYMTLILAVVTAGCVSRLPGAGVPESPAGVCAAALAAAGEGEVEIVELPPLEKWPRTLRGEGPLYGMLQLTPYVGQFGVVSDTGRADDGVGLGAVFGYKMPFRGTAVLGVEVSYGLSQHWNASSSVGASATQAGLGLRAAFRMDGMLNPFATAGLGYYTMAFDNLDSKFDLSGLGGYVGGGVDVSSTKALSIRTEAKLHLWEAADSMGGGGLAETLTVSLGAAWSF